jgi:hypothetical protein
MIPRKTPKPAASLEEIAEAEGLSVSGARLLLSRALEKLRSQCLIRTCRQLAHELDRNRATENVVRRPGRAR